MVTETSGGLTHAYKYDLAGNRLSTVYGGTGRTLISTYDALNRLSTLTEDGRATQYGYDLNGNITQKVAPNGDLESDTFDTLNRATTESATTSADASLFTYQYGYDPTGNVLSVGETYPTSSSNRTVTNTYDAINRLLVEAVTGNVPNVTTTYAYDNANNRTSKVLTGTGASSTTYTYNNLNQLTSYVTGARNVALTYDANGNRISRVITGGSDNGTDTYSYDFENRLTDLVKGTAGTGTGTYNYTYDYRTRRVVRDESQAGGTSTQLVFSGGTSVQEYDNSATTPTVEYIRGSDYGGGVGGILYTLRGGIPSYTHENKRGDVVAKTNASGTLTYQAQYEAFGNQTATTGSTLDRQKSNSKDTDPTNLVDEGMRYRDLETGEFITRDPAGFVDGPNLYTYVRQNPWTGFDPEGLETKQQLEDEQKALDHAYQASKDAINNDQKATNEEKAAGLQSLDEIYSKHKSDIQKRIGKLEQSAKDVARAYGGKPEDYEGKLDDSDPQIQQMMAELDSLDSRGMKDAFLDALHGNYTTAAEGLAEGMILKRFSAVLGMAAKAINLPSVRKIAIDMDHVLSGHTSAGTRAMQSGEKDLFPDAMNAQQVEMAIKQAYANGKKVQTQGERTLIQGTSKNGLKIEMWVNTETKTVETAYPMGAQ